MKKVLIAGLPLGLALMGSPALADDIHVSGNVCRPTAAAAGCVEYSQYGVHNTCASSIVVECPLTVDVSKTNLTDAVFYAYDRNPNTNVSCALQRTDHAGDVQFSASQSTSGGAPGSTWSPESLWNPNFPISLSGYWRLRCTIPAVSSGAFSHVTSISLSTN